MTSLAALLTETYALTARPDLVAETTAAVKAATLKMHQCEYFPKDIYETGIQFSSSAYIQQLAYKSVVPLWRSLKYLRKFDITKASNDSSAGTPGIQFKLISPEISLDSYGVEKVDVVYLAGLNLSIKSSAPFQYALLGCYVLPDITDANFSSWIADEHPYAIEFEAARVVFKTIGHDEESRAYDALVAEQVANLKTSQILAVGY